MDVHRYVVRLIPFLGALITWRVHVGRLQEFLNSDTAYKDIEEISSAIVFFSQVYCRVSAVATLLIYWRSLQLLSMYNFRLRRIGRSFALMAGKLLAYGCLMLVVFLGFFAFATALFGARYVEFHHEGIGLTTAMAMFFGDVTGVQHITDPLFKLFFGSFMIVFYIFSVQMFNAIINYAYNRVSEEMQDQFDRERRQADTKKARKELRRRLAGTRSLVTQCRRCLHRLVRPAAAKRKVGAAAGAEDASRSTEHKKSQPVLEHLDDEMREKVGKWLNGADGQHSTFKMGRVFMFFLYAITYFWFLRVNIIIPVNYEVHAALDSSIKPVAIEVPTWEENKIQYMTWDQLYRVSQVKTWMQEALPTVLFGDPPEERPPCLASWNCVIHLPSADASDRLVLLTAVRRPAAKNEGCLKSPCTDGRTPFLGGPSLVPFRQSPEAGGSSQACTEVFNVTGLPCSTSCTGGELKVQCFLEAYGVPACFSVGPLPLQEDMLDLSLRYPNRI
ncbi:unnamed protein product [Prorocentrum cordatum]|uniref:Polycystin cation channel PKD1/PKD2 domain-containing protein n=1 Tax=Prorocentrum cordatum TaxID=2364126 RepID=A0ABN9W848_9DINO|nr:unnamed protein product [Polarella glacialis]